jgi:hypothetical protein
MKVLWIVILIPVLSFSGILWQDDFNSYNVDDDLDVSPNWDKIQLAHYGQFTVITQKDKDLWLNLFQTAFYMATGGANEPDMMVSLREVYIKPGDVQAGGISVITRLSQTSGYMADYVVNNSYPIPQYFIGIYILQINNGGYSVKSITSREIFEPISSISIVAKGFDPVNIKAIFDDYILNYEDSFYKLTGSCGGISGSAMCGCPAYCDDFIEETTTNTDIEPGSIGCIKALFK